MPSGRVAAVNYRIVDIDFVTHIFIWFSDFSYFVSVLP